MCNKIFKSYPINQIHWRWISHLVYDWPLASYDLEHFNKKVSNKNSILTSSKQEMSKSWQFPGMPGMPSKASRALEENTEDGWNSPQSGFVHRMSITQSLLCHCVVSCGWLLLHNNQPKPCSGLRQVRTSQYSTKSSLLHFHSLPFLFPNSW